MASKSFHALAATGKGLAKVFTGSLCWICIKEVVELTLSHEPNYIIQYMRIIVVSFQLVQVFHLKADLSSELLTYCKYFVSYLRFESSLCL